MGSILHLPDLTDPAQQVARRSPFFDGGPGVDDTSLLALPPGSTVRSIVHDSDIVFFAPGFDGTGAQSIHLQIISLDARSADGTYRSISGQLIKDEYPSLFQPSFGILRAGPGTAHPCDALLGGRHAPDPQCLSTEMGIETREGEAPSEPLLPCGSHGGSPS